MLYLNYNVQKPHKTVDNTMRFVCIFCELNVVLIEYSILRSSTDRRHGKQTRRARETTASTAWTTKYRRRSNCRWQRSVASPAGAGRRHRRLGSVCRRGLRGHQRRSGLLRGTQSACVVRRYEHLVEQFSRRG